MSERCGHETAEFKKIAVANNLAGIKIPGRNQYQPFGSLEDFEQRYVQILRGAHVRGASTEEQFAGLLKANGITKIPQSITQPGCGVTQG